MHPSNLSLPRLLWLTLCFFFASGAAWSQSAPPSRIAGQVSDGVRVTLRGNTHPLAQAQFDQGAAPPDLAMSRMLLVLRRSDTQEAALEKLLDDQQDQNSPSYHQWLTPSQFGQQFGPSDQDIQTIVAWLRSHGFQVAPVSQGRTVLEFSGTAAQVLQAFHTEIHKYVVNGEEHWANASDPQIPAALAPVVVGIDSLHNFPKRPLYHIAGRFSKERNSGRVTSLGSEFTSLDCPSTGTCYFVGPYDFAAIYNLLPLWNATPALDGTGQSIAIADESNINIQDVRDFRNLFGLAANDPQVFVNGIDPGLVPGLETEALLDVEWAGAVAKGATVKLVVSAPTNSTQGADLSTVYATENSLAPVISESFGTCELFLGTAGNSFENAIRQQAAAQGITFITSAGDSGSPGCDGDSGNPASPAMFGLAVNGLASSPYGVALGGTDFLNFGSDFNLNAPSPYWSATNDTNQASALGYVPEMTWNDSCTNNVYVVLGAGNTPEASCNNSQLVVGVITVGGSGGRSNCITSNGPSPSNCLNGYAKPAWQSAPGVPADGVRNIPDVSLFAGNGFMSSAYIVCEADMFPGHGSCSLSQPDFTFVAIGGTSASAPAFAGMMALVNQFTDSSGQGNANYVLYKLASSSAQTSQNCNATSNPANGCIFHDVTFGTIAMPCAQSSPNCNFSNASDVYGVLSGYSASAGYDLATGLGSVNANNLVHNWIGPTNSSSTSLTLNGGQPVSITHGQAVSFTIGVTPAAATGNVSLVGTPTSGQPVSMASFPLQNGTATGNTTALAGGSSYQVKAHYGGDGVYAPSDSSPVTVTIAPEPSKTLITIPLYSSTTGLETSNTPTSVVYGTPVGVRVDVGNAQATTTFPPQLVCTQLTCPTGTVTVTDSLSGGAAAPLSGASGFTLNNGGYAENDGLLLPGGTHQISASYPGDDSYLKSTGNYSLTVTPVTTSISQTFTVTSAIVGTPFGASVIGYSQTIRGVAPTGTVTFYDGKTQIGNSVPISGEPAGYEPQFDAEGTLTLTSGGTHTISGQYSGDANYAASTTSTTVNALYPVTASISVSPSTVTYGTSVTITGVIDTAIPATNAALKPSGTVLVGASLGGNSMSAVTTTTNADPSGNWEIQASAAAIPSGPEAFNLYYNGDSNYGPATASSNLVTVNIPDFSLGPASGITVTPVAGQAGSAPVTVTPLSQTPSPVTLSLYPPIPMSGYTIVITPQTVNLNGAPATAIISLTPTATAPTNIISSQIHRSGLIGTGRGIYWSLSAAAALSALFLMAFPRPRKKYRASLSLAAFCVVLFVLGCGGGSSSSGGGTSLSGSGGGSGGGGSSGPQPTTITLSTSSAKVGVNLPLPITATVTSASGNVVTGNVTFYNFGAAFGSGYSIVNGQFTFQGNVGELGIYQVTASYGGDSNNLPSTTSSPLIQMVTGSIPVMITGNTGVDSHSLPATIGLQ